MWLLNRSVFDFFVHLAWSIERDGRRCNRRVVVLACRRASLRHGGTGFVVEVRELAGCEAGVGCRTRPLVRRGGQRRGRPSVLGGRVVIDVIARRRIVEEARQRGRRGGGSRKGMGRMPCCR